MEREELRRGVLRPARPAGREMGAGGFRDGMLQSSTPVPPD